ncbi:MAG: SDR family oxidoreductase [Actinobacteria bacterium]|nr:SDR family oxidoreductase [Actinomycetota bacterium]
MAIAVVTGAARGLGLAIAERLHAVGYDVVRTDIADTDEQLDVTDAQACRDLARRVQPDIWINNAGVLGAGDAASQDDAVIDQVVSVNLLGVMRGTRAAVEVMRGRDRGRGRGHVVNVGSLASWVPVPGECVYAATKAGVLSFTLGLEGELRAQGVTGIKFTVVCPDGMLTPMITDIIDDPAIAMTFTGLRLVEPDAVAVAVVKVLKRPKRIVSVPKWRGAQVRAIGMVPDAALRAAPLFSRLGRAQQDRVRRGR